MANNICIADIYLKSGNHIMIMEDSTEFNPAEAKECFNKVIDRVKLLATTPSLDDAGYMQYGRYLIRFDAIEAVELAKDIM